MTNKSVPRPEYPRPNFVRDAWMNLNGVWMFDFDPEGRGEESGWHQKPVLSRNITVPFVHQCQLSGIGDIAQVDYVWYAREIDIPSSFLEGRLLLHFGAVDYTASIWVNGQIVGEHSGGFTPFSCDITFAARSGSNLIVVRAYDPISPDIPSGKQSHKESYGCMYTRSTGIWQTVWLEPVSEISAGVPYVNASFKTGELTVRVPILGDADGFDVMIEASGPDGTSITNTEKVIDGSSLHQVRISNPQPWQPGNPALYDLKVTVLRKGEAVDTAAGYCGFRDVQVDGDRILLNRRPFISRGILDQGFWPTGIYTAPSDDELKQDITRSMDHGFNSARLHQKVFEPRTLYWADRLGYPVWAEMPDWGCEVVTPAAQENFRREWQEAVLRDISHPSVIIWTPFNERGTFHKDPVQSDFAREIVSLTHKLDPTRPVCSASGWSHVKETDIVDIHDYDHNTNNLQQRYGKKFDKAGPSNGHAPTFVDGDTYSGQPVIASEVGGIWWDPEQAAASEGWGYGDRPKTLGEFMARYKGVISSLLECEYLYGFVYTQLTDVEQEVNGIYTYDRRPKFDTSAIREINLQKSPHED